MPLTYPQPEGRPLVLAHRGASAHAADNSARAFQIAVDSGAWYAPECFRYLAEARLRAGDLAEADQLIAAGLDLLSSGGPEEFRGNLLTVLGSLRVTMGRVADARAAFEEAIEIHTRGHNSFELAIALFRLGSSASVVQHAEALAHLDQAERLFRKVGNISWTARAGEQRRALAQSGHPSL